MRVQRQHQTSVDNDRQARPPPKRKLSKPSREVSAWTSSVALALLPSRSQEWLQQCGSYLSRRRGAVHERGTTAEVGGFSTDVGYDVENLRAAALKQGSCVDETTENENDPDTAARLSILGADVGGTHRSWTRLRSLFWTIPRRRDRCRSFVRTSRILSRATGKTWLTPRSNWIGYAIRMSD